LEQSFENAAFLSSIDLDFQQLSIDLLINAAAAIFHLFDYF
jgi:hypothetical protein